MAEPFIGEIRMFTCNYAPRGWAFCDGSLLQISQHTTLFSIISTFYGGDGRTTMALPNLQGRAPMNPRMGPGLSYYVLGQSAGIPRVPLDGLNLPEHSHTVTAVKENGVTTNPSGQYLSKMTTTGSRNMLYKKEATNTAPMNSATISDSGNSTPHENMQPYCVVNFCIALDGTYPPRT
ncbi:phage tail protein [Photobacterium kasasachensis]|uniref:phage tail protein n=1 Tax=Photobacterium kasasachensis TaxID=2910240 RepID=UPI003D0D3E21